MPIPFLEGSWEKMAPGLRGRKVKVRRPSLRRGLLCLALGGAALLRARRMGHSHQGDGGIFRENGVLEGGAN